MYIIAAGDEGMDETPEDGWVGLMDARGLGQGVGVGEHEGVYHMSEMFFSPGIPLNRAQS